MKALTALSKYLGYYAQWKNQCKAYNLKWTTGSESIDALQRFFNTNLTLDSMMSKVKEMIRVLPRPLGDVIKFACITGLRPAEACESVRLMSGDCTGYYNQEQQRLEHFRFPEIFLRTTKKAYLSYLSLDNYQWITKIQGKTPTWNAIRLKLRKAGVNCDMRYCRKIHGSWLHSHGVSSEEVDFLQGRVSPSVFGRHYLTPSHDLTDRVLVAVQQLQERIEV
jgi:intergrase/recombinase